MHCNAAADAANAGPTDLHDCLNGGTANRYRYLLDTDGDCETKADGGFGVNTWVMGSLKETDARDEDGTVPVANEKDGVTDACEGKVAQPIFNTGVADGRARPFFDDIHGAGTTTRRPGVVTTTSTTTTTIPYDRTPRCQNTRTRLLSTRGMLIRLTLSRKQKTTSATEFLGGGAKRVTSNDNEKCDILNFKKSGVDAGELMVCNVVYGWALGGRCASVLDRDNGYAIGNKIPQDAGDDTAAELAKATVGEPDWLPKFYDWVEKNHPEAHKQCANHTRTACGNHYFGDAGTTYAAATVRR